jgi:D-alanyl-D-alanine carboxypeptidase
MNMKISKHIKIFLALLVGILLLGSAWSGKADTEQNKSDDIDPASEYSIYLDKHTIERGYTVNAFNNDLKLSLTPEILDDSTYVTAKEVDGPADPWRLKRVSKIYEFEFTNKEAYNHEKPFYIQFSYDIDSDSHKKVFFYDAIENNWKPLPTQDNPGDDFVRSLIHLPYARIAVFSSPSVLTAGKASWYSYKGGAYAASPDFPKGSRLRVFNGVDDKYVDVEVNDYGPDRSVYPDRVIDLDKTAFSRISEPNEGVIDVRVQPLHVKTEEISDKAALLEAPANITPRTEATSGIIMEEEAENVMWEKQGKEKLPLASLTKLVSMYVFLEVYPGDLKDTVTYRKEDEEKNHQYCKPWESAKINLQDGDKVTLEDLFYASLVGSANNAVETLVRASGLNRDEFVNRMNQKVKEWGTVNTHFIEPTGLAPENETSPYDYAVISKKVLSNPLIEKASTMPRYSFTPQNRNREFDFDNTDHLLTNKHFSSINNFKITGSKTGYLDEAGYCLMIRVSPYDADDFIVATFGANTRDESFEETKKLIRYGLKKVRE